MVFLRALAIAAGMVSVSVFLEQNNQQRFALLLEYEKGGAATLIAELAGVTESKIDELASAAHALQSVNGAEAPYNGPELGIAADTAFLVFQNDKQQEYLGGRTSVLGISESFDLERDYYASFAGRTGGAGMAPLGIPLLVTSGSARAPAQDEILVPAAIAEYVGVRSSALANIELIFDAKRPEGPIIRRVDGLRVIGTFDAIGPDEARFAPFWRFAARGRDVLTVRRSDDTAERTTLPVVLNAGLLWDFIKEVRQEIGGSGPGALQMPGRHQLVIRANGIPEVAGATEGIRSLLQQNGMREACETEELPSFCLRLPQRNNFVAALQEQTKFASGASFFVGLLLSLVAIGVAGLQLQSVISHWHDYAVLQALGFTAFQLVTYYALRLLLVVGAAMAIAAIVSLILPSVFIGSLASFGIAAAL